MIIYEEYLECKIYKFDLNSKIMMASFNFKTLKEIDNF